MRPSGCTKKANTALDGVWGVSRLLKLVEFWIVYCYLVIGLLKSSLGTSLAKLFCAWSRRFVCPYCKDKAIEVLFISPHCSGWYNSPYQSPACAESRCISNIMSGDDAGAGAGGFPGGFPGMPGGMPAGFPGMSKFSSPTLWKRSHSCLDAEDAHFFLPTQLNTPFLRFYADMEMMQAMMNVRRTYFTPHATCIVG